MNTQTQNDTLASSLDGHPHTVGEYSMLLLMLSACCVGFILEWMTVGAFAAGGPMRRIGNGLIVSNAFADIVLYTASITAIVEELLELKRAMYEGALEFAILTNGLTCALLHLAIAFENLLTASEMMYDDEGVVEAEGTQWRRRNAVRAAAGAAWLLGGAMAYWVRFEYEEVVVIAVLMGAPLTAAVALHAFTSHHVRRSGYFSRLVATNALELAVMAIVSTPWLMALSFGDDPIPAVSWLLEAKALFKLALYATNREFRAALTVMLFGPVDDPPPTPDNPLPAQIATTAV